MTGGCKEMAFCGILVQVTRKTRMMKKTRRARRMTIVFNFCIHCKYSVVYHAKPFSPLSVNRMFRFSWNPSICLIILLQVRTNWNRNARMTFTEPPNALHCPRIGFSDFITVVIFLNKWFEAKEINKVRVQAIAIFLY
jgi:hypothetical protein